MKHLLTRLGDKLQRFLHQRFLSFFQRHIQPSEGGALSRTKAFFSSELLLSTSVLFLPVLYMTAALALLSGVGLDRWVLPTGLLLWAVAVVALHREKGWRMLVATLLLFVAFFALAAFLTSYLLDRGHDTRLYHATAVLGLLEGVNPYLQPSDWVSLAYPAAHWLLSSSLILWTQSFEASFALTVVATLTAFLCSKRFLERFPRLPRVLRNLLAVLLAANPIATWCFFNHYSDGLLGSTLLSVFMLMLCFVCDEGSRKQARARRRTACWIAALLLLLVNLKFTGLVYGGILGLTALAYGIRRGASRQRLLHLASLGCGVAILGVGLFGFFPYATNVVQGKNPFYPAISFDEKGKRIDTIARWADPEFYAKSNYEKWWISLFSKNGKGGWTDPAPLPPFSSLSSGSFQFGFSSFFSGALLLCLTLVFFVRHKGAWVVLAGVMASVLSTDVSFEFRLTPQNWWLPLLFLVFLLAPDEKKASLLRAQRAVVLVVVACMLYVSVLRFGWNGVQSVAPFMAVRQAKEQGGWVVVPDEKESMIGVKQGFFNYYKSGLTSVNLPFSEECPEKAERRRLVGGLMLCRP